MDKQLTPTGAKAHQRTDTEWRSQPYSDWHRTLPRWMWMTDVDFIEWRLRDGKLTAVAVIEVTRVDVGRAVGPGYLDAIIRRFEERDLQASAARKVAEALGTKAYIVLFRTDCSEFWVYNLSDRHGWKHFPAQEMEEFLAGL